MNVLVVGTGYVGLVTGLCFAKAGHTVTCVDRDEVKIGRLRRGQVPIYEDGLEELLVEQLSNGSIQFTTQVPDPADFDISLIAVGTPSRPGGSVDMSYVYAVVDELALKVRIGSIVATKSTVPVGTADRIRERFVQLSRPDIRIASLPEFLREGTAVKDTLHPSRLVFGVSEPETEVELRDLHIWVDAPVVVTDCRTAEMIKYASNAFLATKISFINEIANVCDRVGADVRRVADGMGLDTRIGQSFLRAGLGYGGSCFPKDTRALVGIAGDVDYDFKLLKAVIEVNASQKVLPMEFLLNHFGTLTRRRITLLGVAFKPGTDDTRESPVFDMLKQLRSEGAEVTLCDPVASEVVFDGREFSVVEDISTALTGADAAVLLTEWPQFITFDWLRHMQIMRHPVVFDGRNVLNPVEMTEAGYVIRNVGAMGTPKQPAVQFS